MKITTQEKLLNGVFAIGIFVVGILVGLLIAGKTKPPVRDYTQPNLVAAPCPICKPCAVCQEPPKCESPKPVPKVQRGISPAYVKELAEACAEQRITKWGCN